MTENIDDEILNDVAEAAVNEGDALDDGLAVGEVLDDTGGADPAAADDGGEEGEDDDGEEDTTVPPIGAEAEVVILCTSLGAARKSFFGSRRTQHLMDCAGHPYYAIDSNKDVGRDRLDQALIAQWHSQGLLHPDPKNPKNLFLVPQVIIDGVSIGDFQALQDLCEDGDLEWILARAECPNCLGGRDPNDSTCGHCGVTFQELIPAEAVEQKLVVQWLRGVPAGAAEELYEVDFAAGGEKAAAAYSIEL